MAEIGITARNGLASTISMMVGAVGLVTHKIISLAL
jgi:hypothetical protein